MGWARWEKRRISHLTHFAPCPSPGARRSDRTLASDRASSGAGVRTPRLLNALQGVCGLQRPHSDLTATSQRPHRDLTATSQRPRSDLTATSQRPHRDPTATSHSAFSSRRSSIDPPTRHPQSLSPHFPRDPPRDLSAEIYPPPFSPPHPRLSHMRRPSPLSLQLLQDVADDFVENVAAFACELVQHRCCFSLAHTFHSSHVSHSHSSSYIPELIVSGRARRSRREMYSSRSRRSGTCGCRAWAIRRLSSSRSGRRRRARPRHIAIGCRRSGRAKHPIDEVADY